MVGHKLGEFAHTKKAFRFGSVLMLFLSNVSGLLFIAGRNNYIVDDKYLFVNSLDPNVRFSLHREHDPYTLNCLSDP